MRLQIKTKHFKDTIFGDPEACAVAKAAKEHFGNSIEDLRLSEGVTFLQIDKRLDFEKNVVLAEWAHPNYGVFDFLTDRDKAEKSDNPEEVIRELELTEVFNNLNKEVVV